MQDPKPFRFKQFSIAHDRCAHKVGTDGVLLGAWTQAINPKKILDIGTGSGLIALMLAQRFPNAHVVGIELDPTSAEQAKENVANSSFSNRVDIIQGDFLNHDFEQPFDLIVSNPPFFKGNTSTGKMERDRARHEQFLPQTGFMLKAFSLLTPKAKLMVILPKEEAKNLIKEGENQKLYLSKLTKVYGNINSSDKRWLMEFNQRNEDYVEAEFILREKGGSYGQQYMELTKDFHLDF